MSKSQGSPPPQAVSDKYNFVLYIYKVAAQSEPEVKMTTQVREDINLIVHHVAKKVSVLSRNMVNKSGKRTVMSEHIESAVKELFPGQLGARALVEGAKALKQYELNKSVKGGRNVARRVSSRAALQFPVSRVTHVLRTYTGELRLSLNAGIFLAGVLECVAAELVVAGASAYKSLARAEALKRMTNLHLKMGINNDAELKVLLRNTWSTYL
jgi:hypothetical protein